MSDEAKEAERLQRLRMELAEELSGALNFALGAGLQSEAALIALLINAVLTNTTNDLLMKLRTTKPGA